MHGSTKRRLLATAVVLLAALVSMGKLTAQNPITGVFDAIRVSPLKPSSGLYYLCINSVGAFTSQSTLCGVTPNGAAGGDLTGTYPNPTLGNVLTAGSCTNCGLTYDAKGRITVAANGSTSGSTPTGPAAGSLSGTYPNPGLAATQAAVTTMANLSTVGTITSGVWNAGAVTSSGLINAVGFGTHGFSSSGTGGNILQVNNTSAGPSNYASAVISGDTTSVEVGHTASNFAASGVKPSNGGYIQSAGAGGLSIAATDAAGTLRLYAGGTTLRAQINANGTQTWAAYGSGTAVFDASGNITSATTLPAATVGSSLTSVGTIASGVWNAGAVTATTVTSNGTLTAGGVLTVNGFGTHGFGASGTGGNVVQVVNTSTGLTNYAGLVVSGDTSNLELGHTSSNFFTTGVKPLNGGYLQSAGAGGFALAATDAAGTLRFYVGGTTLRAQINVNGTQTWSAYGSGTAVFDTSGNITSATTLPAATVGSSLTSVGTITSGAWNAGALTSNAVLTINAFGTNSFSGGGTGGNVIQIVNSSAGSGNYGAVVISGDTTNLEFGHTSSNFGATGIKPSNGGYVQSAGVGGLSIGGTDAAATLKFYAGGTTLRARINANGTQTWAVYGAGTAAFDASGNITSVTTLPAATTGSSLTSVGTITSGTWNAGAGTLTDASLSSNVPLLNAANVFTAAQTLSKNQAASTSYLVANTTASASAQAQVILQNDDGVDGFYTLFSSSVSNSGDKRSGGVQIKNASSGLGGLSGGITLSTTNVDGAFRFYTGGNVDPRLDVDIHGVYIGNATRQNNVIFPGAVPYNLYVQGRIAEQCGSNTRIHNASPNGSNFCLEASSDQNYITAEFWGYDNTGLTEINAATTAVLVTTEDTWNQDNNIAIRTIARNNHAACATCGGARGLVVDIENNGLGSDFVGIQVNPNAVAMTAAKDYGLQILNTSAGIAFSADFSGNIVAAGGATVKALPTSAGAGGLYVCVDNVGVFYKKSACP